MKSTTVIILALIGILMLVCVLAISQTKNAPPEPTPGPHPLRPASGSSIIVCGVTEAAYNQLVKAVNARDVYGVGELSAAGLTFSVDAGTSALVIDRATFLRKVRILAGPHVGEACWTARERVE